MPTLVLRVTGEQTTFDVHFLSDRTYVRTVEGKDIGEDGRGDLFTPPPPELNKFIFGVPKMFRHMALSIVNEGIQKQLIGQPIGDTGDTIRDVQFRVEG